MSYNDKPFLPQMLSPTAYEMSRYGRMPISYFTGRPVISIPLTELRAKDYTLPVSLSYNAGGHKPDQHPGWVGLGWSLHAGGSIVRVVNGMKDEMSAEEYCALHAETPSNDPGYIYRTSEVQNETDWQNDLVMSDKCLPWMDYEPDEYIINIDGIHASFYITGQNQISIVSNNESSFALESYEIASDSDDSALDMYPGQSPAPFKARRYKYLKKFIIRDKNGNRYVFGGDDSAIEYSIIQYPTIQKNNNIYFNRGVWKAIATANAWMLVRIERVDGEVISFEYEKNGVPVVVRDLHHGETFVCETFAQMTNSSDTYASMLDGYKSNLNIYFLLPSYLKKIHSYLTGDELEFITEDTNELKYALTEEEFSLCVGDWSDRYVPGPFTYDQFMSNDRYRKLVRICGTYRDVRLEYAESSLSRLRLTGVSFYVPDGTSVCKDNGYTFEYDSLNLPSYNSRKTDVWGYYNGISYEDLLGGFGVGLTSRRVASESHAKAEILTCITYPTGGRTEFTYELHRYSKRCLPIDFNLDSCVSEGVAGGLRIKSITDYAFDGTPQTRMFEYSENGESSGILTAIGDCRKEGNYTFRNDYVMYEGSFVLYSEIPLLPLSETDGSHVTYSCVREHFPDGGYIEYRYSNSDEISNRDSAPENEVGRVSGFPLYPQFASKAIRRGLLTSQKIFRSDGRLVSEENYVYGNIGTSHIKSVSQHRYFNGAIVFAAYMRHYCGYPALVQKTMTEYVDDNGTISDVYQYSYNSQRLVECVRHSRGSEVSEELTYFPKDRSSNNIYAAMLEKGMYGVPVGKAVLKKGVVVEGTEIHYSANDVITDIGVVKTVILPEKSYSTALPSPVILSNYASAPQSYMKTYPDFYVKSRDSRGNIGFVGLGNGSAYEHHWTKRTDQMGFRIMTEDIPDRIVLRQQNLRLEIGNTLHLSTSFRTDAESPFQFRISADQHYAWYIYVTIDGVTYYLASWAISEMPDTIWQERLSLGNVLNLTLSPGEHVLTMGHLAWKGSGGLPDLTAASASYSYYEREDHEEHASFVDLDIDSETGDGFRCSKAHVGPLTVSHPVSSGKSYEIDFMRKTDGLWQYCRIPYSGGEMTLGDDGSTISHVRIYPSDSMPESYVWNPYIGMSAKVNAHGVSESYAYDGMGRLASVIDNDGNRISSHSYVFNPVTRDNVIWTDVFISADGIQRRSVADHYDGLGRKSQNVIVNGSNQNGDIITLYEYDLCDREIRLWNPVPVPYGSGRPSGGLVSKEQLCSFGDAMYGSDETERNILNVYEASPRDRLLRKYLSGTAWREADKAVRSDVYTNSTDPASHAYHRGFKVEWYDTGLMLRREVQPTAKGHFIVEKTEDEDGRLTYTFKDMYGASVLIRRIGDEGIWYDTHYLYDAFGRLSAILPPKLTAELEASGSSVWEESDLAALAYLYRYDGRGNCIARLVPGGGWIYQIYDRGNRALMTQDAVQRNGNVWTFRFSDIFGRECVSGTVVLPVDVFADPFGQANVYVRMPSSPEYSGQLKGYELVGVDLDSSAISEIHKVNYYDGYGFIDSSAFSSSTRSAVAYEPISEDIYGARYDLSEKGQLTGTLIKVLGSSGSDNLLLSVYYYDDRGRVVQEKAATHLNGYRKDYYAYDFVGNLIRRKTDFFSAFGLDVTEEYTYTYDVMGRPLSVLHKVGDGVQRIVSSKEYDPIGRLKSEHRNGLASLKEDISYNVRSWVTCISGTFFHEELGYNAGTAPQWGGNISLMQWKHSPDDEMKGYVFRYDSLSRLKSSSYFESSLSDVFSEAYGYDRNGNMLSFIRNGLSTQGTSVVQQMNLAMSYSGNRLSAAGPSMFEYDAKGREILSSMGTVIGTEYNVLDLPQRRTIGLECIVETIYDASGRKLQERVVSDSYAVRRDYVGNCIYENGVLKKIIFGGGYVDMSGESLVYMFFLTDHLGSVRVVVSESGDVVQTNQYYPFGDLIEDVRLNPGNSDNRFRYTGKELSDETGLYDFSARYLNARLGRFTTIDPLAEKNPHISPYLYCNNNPVRFIDPNGMDWYQYMDEEGHAHTMWFMSQDKAFRDANGNVWSNIGENMLSITDEAVTLFTQYEDSNCDLCLNHTSYKINMDDSGSSVIGDIPSFLSEVLGLLGEYTGKSKVTFRITNSKGALDFRLYINGWKGNQWVIPYSVSGLSDPLMSLGKMLGVTSIIASSIQLYKASTIEERIEYGTDVAIGAIGLMPYGAPVSAYWSLGGKKLHYMYLNNVLIPQIEMGINPGLPAYQPFK